MDNQKTVEINTPFGPVCCIESQGVLSAHRLRYAIPPLEEHRFALPVPITPWTTPLDCTKKGLQPLQLPCRLDSVMGEYSIPMGEDCLHLDVWAPSSNTENAPVLVYIHGGAFITGSGSYSCYDGSQLVKNTGMVVVNISYRIGALGFLPIDDIAPANLGLHDQLCALDFIQKVVSSFGGDPNNVTIAGQSAGAHSVAIHLDHPASRQYFHRAIMMSAPLGAKLHQPDKIREIAAAYLEELGVKPGDREALCRVSSEELLRAQKLLQEKFAPSGGEITPPFIPSVDGDFVTSQPGLALREGSATDIDVMIGTTREEMAAFLPTEPAIQAEIAKLAMPLFQRRFGEQAVAAMKKAAGYRVPSTPFNLISDVQTQAIFTEGSLEAAAGHSDNGGTTYVYSFDWQAPSSKFAACHCIDLPFLFGNLDVWVDAPMLDGAGKQEMENLVDIFQGAIAAFVRSGSPNGDSLPDWHQYGKAGLELHFDRRITVGSTRT